MFEVWGKEFLDKLVSSELMRCFLRPITWDTGSILQDQEGKQPAFRWGQGRKQMGVLCDAYTQYSHWSVLAVLDEQRTHAALIQNCVQRKEGKDARGHHRGKLGSWDCERGGHQTCSSTKWWSIKGQIGCKVGQAHPKYQSKAISAAELQAMTKALEEYKSEEEKEHKVFWWHSLEGIFQPEMQGMWWRQVGEQSRWRMGQGESVML